MWFSYKFYSVLNPLNVAVYVRSESWFATCVLSKDIFIVI